MKRLTLIIFIFIVIKATAQDTSPIAKAFSAGLETQWYSASNSIYSIGLGFSGKAEIPASNRIYITITAGYTTFFYKSNLYQSSLTHAPAGFVPLKAGVKYYFNPGIYIEGELGTVIETNYLKHDPFAFSAGPGLLIPINEKHSFDLGFRYENWSDHSLRQTAIRFAYRFGGG